MFNKNWWFLNFQKEYLNFSFCIRKLAVAFYMINEIQPKMKFQNIVQCPFKSNIRLVQKTISKIIFKGDKIRWNLEQKIPQQVFHLACGYALYVPTCIHLFPHARVDTIRVVEHEHNFSKFYQLTISFLVPQFCTLESSKCVSSSDH